MAVYIYFCVAYDCYYPDGGFGDVLAMSHIFEATRGIEHNKDITKLIRLNTETLQVDVFLEKKQEWKLMQFENGFFVPDGYYGV